MAKSIRIGVFETNSSSIHTLTIHLSGYTLYTTTERLEKEDNELYIPGKTIDELLDCIPIEKLEKKIKERTQNENKKK